MKNLAELILDRAERRPRARFGTVEAPLCLEDAVAIARRAAGGFAAAGLTAGKRAALVGETTTSYLLAWMALQLAGVEAGLVNPALPDDLLRAMLANLGVDGVVWASGPAEPSVAPAALHLDARGLGAGWGEARSEVRAGLPRPYAHPQERRREDAELKGLDCRPEDIAGYMHTSGTTGLPKFCAQSHGYYLRLGRFVADAMAISPADTVFAPLPMFHVNPLGYGLVGGLTGGADVLGTERFSARRFWPTVREQGVTVAFLHAPPVEILKRATMPEDAAGHSLRCVFYADAEFLERFQVPLAYSCYGSTEAGGVTHFWTWRLGDRCNHPEGMSRFAGLPRHDVEWDLTADGEILVRGRQEGVLSSGYRMAGELAPLAGEDGWFHTGDAGRTDGQGHLIFVERMAESIKVKGEYVPISYVEGAFAQIEELAEVALWRRAGKLVDHEVVLYAVGHGPLPIEKLVQTAEGLPRFMRPVSFVRIASMPRTAGVGKVSRRQLDTLPVLERIDL